MSDRQRLRRRSSVVDALAPHITATGQRELSRRCGVPQAKISEYLAGKGDPTTRTVDRMLDAMGLEIIVIRERKT